MAPILDTAKPEGRPATIKRPLYFHNSMNPAVELKSIHMEPHINGETNVGERPLKLPPGYDMAKFESAIAELKDKVGAENVTLNNGPLNDGNYYVPPLSHDGFALWNREYFVASAVVAPGSTEDTVVIVKWANHWEFPLWPVSVGRNLGYGGAAPRVPGSLIVDMGKRMNKVLSVDETNSSCVVQPGVTFIDLYENLQARGLGNKLWIDVPDLGGGSVIGNNLERGIGYTAYGDHWKYHCGLEVVLPDGEVIRTGMEAIPNSTTGQCFQYSFGPAHDGLFSQGNFGIVTRMGLWLMPNPGGLLPFMITFSSRDDLGPAVEAIRPLMINRILGNVPSLRLGTWDAALYGTREDFFPGHDKPITDEMGDEMIKKLGTGHWVFYGALYGPENVIKPTFDYVKQQFAHIPGHRFHLRGDATVRKDSYLHDRAHVFAGIPSFDELRWLNWIPNAGHLFFSPIAPLSGDVAVEQISMTRKRCLEYGFDYHPTFYIGDRAIHHINALLYDRSKPDEQERARKCVSLLIDDFAKKGWGEYRTHIGLQDQVAATYGWNNHALRKFSEKLKDAVDPKGIMQPGRGGVWPRNYRGQGWEIWKDTKVPKDPQEA